MDQADKSLDDHLKEKEKLQQKFTIDEILSIFHDIIEYVSFFHKNGFIHSDIKP